MSPCWSRVEGVHRLYRTIFSQREEKKKEKKPCFPVPVPVPEISELDVRRFS
jgi:hypothetical protein